MCPVVQTISTPFTSPSGFLWTAPGLSQTPQSRPFSALLSAVALRLTQSLLTCLSLMKTRSQLTFSCILTCLGRSTDSLPQQPACWSSAQAASLPSTLHSACVPSASRPSCRRVAGVLRILSAHTVPGPDYPLSTWVVRFRDQWENVFLHLHFLITLIESTVTGVNVLFFIADLRYPREREQRNISFKTFIYIQFSTLFL